MSALLERLEASTRARAAETHDVVRVAPFTAYVDTHRSEKWASGALADPGTGAEAAPALPELAAAFAARDRVPRLEVHEELCPDLAGACVAAGWTRAESGRVMTCEPGDLTTPPAPPGVEVVVPAPDAPEGFVRAWDRVLVIAFEDEDPQPANVAFWRERAAEDFLAAALAEGRVAGTAVATRVTLGVTEVMNVATLPEHRRRGVAGHLAAVCAAAAFAAGAQLAWLAAYPGALGIYARAGFAPLGTRTTYEAPRATWPRSNPA